MCEKEQEEGKDFLFNCKLLKELVAIKLTMNMI